MKAIIRKNTTSNNSNESNQSPRIYVTRFDGNYDNTFLEMSVNDMFVVVATSCLELGCYLMSIGCEEENREAVDMFEPEIMAYVTHFLDNRHFKAFDGPLSSGSYVVENTQFEILDYNNDNGRETVQFLVDGAFAEVSGETDNGHVSLKVNNVNKYFIDDILPIIHEFFDPLLCHGGEDVLRG